MPRWVKVFVVIAAVAAIALVVSLLVGVEHGPGQHSPRDEIGNHSPAQHGP